MNKSGKEPEAGQKPDQPFFPEHMHITTGEKGWSAAQSTYCHPVRGYTPLGMQLVSWSPQTDAAKTLTIGFFIPRPSPFRILALQ